MNTVSVIEHAAEMVSRRWRKAQGTKDYDAMLDEVQGFFHLSAEQLQEAVDLAHDQLEDEARECEGGPWGLE